MRRFVLSAMVVVCSLAMVSFGASHSLAAKKNPLATGPSLTSLAVNPIPAKQTNLTVLGDSLGRGVWAGLYHAFRNNKNIKITRKTKSSTGFVRLDFYDWNANLAQILMATKIDIAVVMVGANDRQTIVTKAGRHKPGSPRWREIYASRVDSFIRKLIAHGAKVYWVGLPITRSKKYTRHMRVLNEIFADRAQANNIAFVDIWKDFTTANGQYSSHGKDIKGRTRKLRDNDGVHFTMRGYQKLALAAENQIRADFGKTSPSVVVTKIAKAKVTPQPKLTAIATKEPEIVQGKKPVIEKQSPEIKIATVDPKLLFVEPAVIDNRPIQPFAVTEKFITTSRFVIAASEPEKVKSLQVALNTMAGQLALTTLGIIRKEVPNSLVSTISWPKFQPDRAYLAKNMKKIEKTDVGKAIRQALANDFRGILGIVQPDKAVVVDKKTAYAPVLKVQKSKNAVLYQRLQQRKIATLSLDPEVHKQSGKAHVTPRVTGSVRPVSIESGTPDDSVEYATETTYGQDAFTGTSKLASIASVSGLDFDSVTNAEGILSTIVYRTLLRGNAVSPKAGRGDDFSWPRD